MEKYTNKELIDKLEEIKQELVRRKNNIEKGNTFLCKHSEDVIILVKIIDIISSTEILVNEIVINSQRSYEYTDGVYIVDYFINDFITIDPSIFDIVAENLEECTTKINNTNKEFYEKSISILSEVCL